MRPPSCSRTRSTARPRNGRPPSRAIRRDPAISVEHLRMRFADVLQAVRFRHREGHRHRRARPPRPRARRPSRSAPARRHSAPAGCRANATSVGGVGHLRQERRAARSCRPRSRARPAAASAAIHAFLASSGMTRSIVCSPSRGPTSLIRMSVMRSPDRSTGAVRGRGVGTRQCRRACLNVRSIASSPSSEHRLCLWVDGEGRTCRRPT